MSAATGGYWVHDYGEGRRVLRNFVRLTAFIVFFVVWEALGRSGKFFAIVPASETLVSLWGQLTAGVLWGPMWGTLKIAMTGYIFAAVAGVLVGSLIGVSKAARAALDPLINAGQATPMAMMIPVLGIYVGLGFDGKVVLVFLFCFWVIAVNTSAGIAFTPTSLRETARAFGIRGLQMYTKLVFPNALPSIVTGLRLGIGRAVQGAVLADLFLFVENLGESLVRAGSTFDMARLLGITLLIVILGSAFMALARYLERRVLKWLYV